MRSSALPAIAVAGGAGAFGGDHGGAERVFGGAAGGEDGAFHRLLVCRRRALAHDADVHHAGLHYDPSVWRGGDQQRSLLRVSVFMCDPPSESLVVALACYPPFDGDQVRAIRNELERRGTHPPLFFLKCVEDDDARLPLRSSAFTWLAVSTLVRRASTHRACCPPGRGLLFNHERG